MAMIVSLEIPIPTFTGKDPLQSTIVTSFADPRPGQNAQPLTTTLYVAFTSPTPPQTMTTIPVTLPALTSSASAVPTPPSSTVPPASSSSPGGPFVPHSPAGNGNGISGGAVAGVAIGCLIAGAVITFIACFFLYRRRNQKYPEPYIQSHLPYDTEQKSGAAVRTAPLPSAGIAARSSLPQPAEDAAISKEVSKIRDNIKNHVQNFYHYQPVHRGIGGAELTALAAATNLDPSVVETMLANPSTRSDTIRLFIAWAILSRCEGQRQPTLLPCELAPILETVAGQGGKDNVKSGWFRQWRVLTGALLGQEGGAGFQASNIDTQNWSNIVDSMDLGLGPFVQAGSDEAKRRRNLEMVLARAAQLAFLLFSQPGSFRFDFAGSRPECLVVFPSLVQVAGDEGQVLSPVKVLWQKEMASD